MALFDCKLIELTTIPDDRGNLTVIEGGEHVPFEVRRVYYLHDVPAGSGRGGHAHKSLRQLMIAIAGRFEVVLNDGRSEQRFTLQRPNVGLLITPMIWRTLENFSNGAVCCVLASDHYAESDYIRDFAEFSETVRSR